MKNVSRKIKEIFNKRVNCTKLVKRNEDGSYDVTGVLLLGEFIGAAAAFTGIGIGAIIDHLRNK